MSVQSYGLHYPHDDLDDEPALLSDAWCARVAKVRISDRMTYTEEERMHGVRLGAEAMRNAILADPTYYGLQVERPETVSRWNKGKALPHASTEKQLLELEFVIDKLADIYEPHDARLWLFARQRLLDDQVPAELIQQGRVDEVLASVNQLLDGVHL